MPIVASQQKHVHINYNCFHSFSTTTEYANLKEDVVVRIIYKTVLCFVMAITLSSNARVCFSLTQLCRKLVSQLPPY